MDIVHYILVRRDLPFGTTLAMVAHAAAESNPGNHYTVVVLGVRNLGQLKRWLYKLESKDIKHVAIREPDMPWNNQLMSIGVEPGPRELLGPVFTKLQTYRDWVGGLESGQAASQD